MHFLYGINAVYSVLKANKRLFRNIWINKPQEKTQIYNLVKELKIPSKIVSINTIQKQVPGRVHQGILLQASDLEIPSVQSPQEISGNFWVMLDQITDPQNLGAIIRTAEFFQVSGLILPSKSTAPLTSTVVKASSGATDFLQMIRVTDFPAFLKKAKPEYQIVGAYKGRDLFGFKSSDKKIVVFGNQHWGIRQRVLKECDQTVWIQSQSPIGSLNVSSAFSAVISYFKFN